MAHYSFLFPIAGKVLEIIGSPLVQKLSLAWGMKDDLQKLEMTITFVRAVLLDADDKQYQDGNHQLRDWMGRLKTALSEADDLLDDLQIHSLRHQTSQQSAMGKVRTFFSPGSNQLSFRFKMSQKIKKLRERFDEIASIRHKFNLAERLVERGVMMRRETTHSFVDESGVLGRSLDKENIILRLMHTSYKEKLPVIPIIGIGGLGKTTLVQVVYNDRRIVDHFDLRMWVCISDDFALRSIISKVLQAIKGADYRHLETDQLQFLLRQNLQDRKYLLVLDDVWNEERDKWTGLMDLLTANSRASESRVIVTARSELVAAVVAPITSMYKLDRLSDEDCLSLLLNWASWRGEEATLHPNLIEIGRQIVERCKGVPLAIRTLGKLLYLKTEEREWVYVRDNDIWESGKGEGDILPALKLSYYQLPSHLKQCFAYCSLFPKDLEFSEAGLVEIWRAQGLIRLEKYKTLEETGKEYIALLVSRGFFKEHKILGFTKSYKIHGLLHDLALSVAKPDCISKITDPVLHSSMKVQHLSFVVDDLRGDQIPDELLRLMQQLRCFLLFGNPQGSHSSFNSFIETCISSFKLLRVLRLVSSSVKKFPRSIGRLRHLRYLDLSFNDCVKSLPSSVCDLVCLETLNLSGCVELEKLPEGLGKLIRLKCLYVTTKERCLPEKEITCLKALQILMIEQCRNMEFLLSDDGIKCLSSLRTLSIVECKSLVSLPTNGMRQLHNLENLAIGECEKLDLGIGDYHYFQAAGRRGGLNSLLVFRLPILETFPSWLLHGANALKQIIVFECPNLTTLMSEQLLESLVFLQVLQIIGCPELKYLPNGMHRLTFLKEIILRDCPQLVSRCMRDTGEDWHKISHIPNIYFDGIEI